MRNQCLVGVRSPVLTVAVLAFAIAFSFDTLARAPLLATLFEAWLGLWYAPVRLLASAIQVFCVVALTSWIVRRTYLPGVADGLAPAEVDRQWVPSYVDGIAERLRRARLFGTPVSVVLGRLGYGATWLVVWGSIAWLFAWTASGGTYRFQSASVPYYDLLADAFLAGQFHLLIAPRPELLALANPYDPVLNGPLRLPDASLYNGKYYLYFGPVPGLIHAGWKLLTGWRLEEGTMLLAASLWPAGAGGGGRHRGRAGAGPVAATESWRWGMGRAALRTGRVPVRPVSPRRLVHAVVIRRSISDLDELAYSLVYAPTDPPLVEIVRVIGARWTIEEVFELAKQRVGLDEYEVRSSAWQKGGAEPDAHGTDLVPISVA